MENRNRLGVWTWLIFNALFQWDECDQLQPVLAESCTLSTDQRKYTFQLRRGVLFHNGTELTARDVKYSLDYLLRLQYAGVDTRPDHHIESWQVDDDLNMRFDPEAYDFHISRIETPTPHTVIVSLEQPSHHFYAVIALLPILPAQAHQQMSLEAFLRTPIGTGAFQFGQRDAQTGSIRLDAFDEHFRGRPGLGFLQLNADGSVPAMKYENQAGEAVTWPFFVTERQPEHDNPDYRTYTLNSGMSLIRLRFSPDVKQALGEENFKMLQRILLTAIDWAGLGYSVFQGRSMPAHSFVPVTSPWFNRDIEQYTYNPETAKALRRQIPRGQLENLSFNIAVGDPYVLVVDQASPIQSISDIRQRQTESPVKIGVMGSFYTQHRAAIDDIMAETIGGVFSKVLTKMQSGLTALSKSQLDVLFTSQSTIEPLRSSAIRVIPLDSVDAHSLSADKIRQIATYVQETLAELKITVNLVPSAETQQMMIETIPVPDMTWRYSPTPDRILGFNPDDETSCVYQLSAVPSLEDWWANPFDNEKLHQVYNRLQEQFAQELPSLCLWHIPRSYLLMNQHIKGLPESRMIGPGVFLGLHQWHIEDQ